MRKSNQFTISLMVMGLGLLTSSLFSQSLSKEAAWAKAKEQIKELHEGTLIVRIPTQHKKIAALEELLQNKELSPANRKRLEDQLETTRQEAQNFSLYVLEAFDTVYDFSKVLFMYDTDMAALQSSNPSGFFLNREGKADASIVLDQPNFYLLRFGFSTGEATSHTDAMIITDATITDLQKPFPYEVRLTDFISTVGRVLPAPEQEKKDIARAVAKLNRNLHKFFVRMVY
ncbi:MAG TPA: hypothetical protein PKA00_03785 [Saprospiraceae bacterium]|nr:hypothetical protein [Saprospiraceae bacterium]HMQ81998.1 hypothetical protein [Saprospiraceae bacterium]